MYHLRCHSPLFRENECPVCREKFDSEDVPRSHLKRHIGQPECGCQFCDRTFVKKKHLQKHMWGAHGMVLEMKN